MGLREPLKNIFYSMPPTIKSAVYNSLTSRPMNKVIKTLEERGIKLKELNALEVFGRDGEWHTLNYAPKVSSLEIWEIDPQFEKSLKRNFPRGNVRIVDSFQEIKRTTNKYNLIVVDNPMSTYGDKYCEHFQLFPDVLNLCHDSALLVLNIIPEVSEDILKTYPYLFNNEHLEHRRSFYKTEKPEKLSVSEMIAAYRDILNENGFNLEWAFEIKRSFVYYLVLKIKKETSFNVNN